jgi:hypothetical protein
MPLEFAPTGIQCCGSGSGAFFNSWIRDPGWKKIRIRDEHHAYISESLGTVTISGLKIWYLNSLMRIRIRIPDLFDPGSGTKELGSGINIPDPQHWGYLAGISQGTRHKGVRCAAVKG